MLRPLKVHLLSLIPEFVADFCSRQDVFCRFPSSVIGVNLLFVPSFENEYANTEFVIFYVIWCAFVCIANTMI